MYHYSDGVLVVGFLLFYVVHLRPPVVVHTYEFVREELESRGFVKAYFDFAEHVGSSTRAFIRTSMGTNTT
jgi:hypothetical protein